MKKKTLLSLSSLLLWTPWVLAESSQNYVIAQGEVLSKIVQREFPNEKIYGKKGKLRAILALNPHIKNPDRLRPGEIILLPKLCSVTQAPPIEEARIPADTKSSLIPLAQEDEALWNFQILMGPKYYSVSQSGALGSAKLGLLFFDNLKAQTEFKSGEWAVALNLERYKFKYNSPASSQKENFYNLGAKFSYHQWVAELTLEENPLFKTSPQNVEMAKLQTLFAGFGMQKEIAISSRKKTELKLKVLMLAPLAANSDKLEAKVHSPSGYGARLEAGLSRQLVKKENYALCLKALSQLEFKQFSYQADWGTKSGKRKRRLWNFQIASVSL